ncbi:MAG: hypothetical protein ACK5VH_05720, partial [bacterium]
SYMVRRQLAYVTNRANIAQPLTTDEVEDIINFINDKTINVIPKALYKFSSKERWTDGFDYLAIDFYERLRKLDSHFAFSGDFSFSDMGAS